MRKALAALAAVALIGTAGVALGDKKPGPDTISGTAGDDYLTGGRSPDVLYGLAGDDDIWGQRAPDLLYGGRGNDRLHGFGSGETSDLLDGGPGWDTCIATRRDVLVSCEVVRIRKGLGQR